MLTNYVVVCYHVGTIPGTDGRWHGVPGPRLDRIRYLGGSMATSANKKPASGCERVVGGRGRGGGAICYIRCEVVVDRV